MTTREWITSLEDRMARLRAQLAMPTVKVHELSDAFMLAQVELQSAVDEIRRLRDGLDSIAGHHHLCTSECFADEQCPSQIARRILGGVP